VPAGFASEITDFGASCGNGPMVILLDFLKDTPCFVQ